MKPRVVLSASNQLLQENNNEMLGFSTWTGGIQVLGRFLCFSETGHTDTCRMALSFCSGGTNASTSGALCELRKKKKKRQNHPSNCSWGLWLGSRACVCEKGTPSSVQLSPCQGHDWVSVPRAEGQLPSPA